MLIMILIFRNEKACEVGDASIAETSQVLVCNGRYPHLKHFVVSFAGIKIPPGPVKRSCI